MRHPTPAPPTRVDAVDGLGLLALAAGGRARGRRGHRPRGRFRKESHHDFARLCRDSGLAAIAFDVRGHGDSPGPLDGRALADVATIAGLLPSGPIALRGSSMGGYLALAAAERAGADAVVAICPAPSELLARGLREARFDFAVDRPALTALLDEHDLRDVVDRSRVPLMLLHAEGDERVPVEHSIELERRSIAPLTRLLVLPGGHHRSVQHDAELQAEAVRFIRRAFAARA
jgi:pimeloyl-ACP methyl ester carboxylesterase